MKQEDAQVSSFAIVCKELAYCQKFEWFGLSEMLMGQY
jgi:hypothetical protein